MDRRRSPLGGAGTRKALLSVAAVALAVMLPAAPAQASSDVSPSTLKCSDITPSAMNPGTLRPGDQIDCALVVQISTAPGNESAFLSATATVPSNTSWVSGGSYDSGSNIIDLGATTQGVQSPGATPTLHFTLSVNADAPIASTVAPTAHITGQSYPSGTPVDATVPTSPPILQVAPPPADLSGSTMSCLDDLGDTTPQPGDLVHCTATISDAAAHEDATNAQVTLSVPGAKWVSGGSSGFFDLGTIASGTSAAPVMADFQISEDLAAGISLVPQAFGSATNALSGGLFFFSALGPNLVTKPGVARLTDSTLTCSDTNAGSLLSGDDLACVVKAVATPGREDASNVTATIGLPTGLSYVSGGSVSGGVITVSLGSIPAGSARTATFHVAVASDAPVGKAYTLSGSIGGTSLPSGRAINATSLTSNTLTVGTVNTDSGGPVNAADLSVSGMLDQPAAGRVVLSTKTHSATAHLVVTLHNAGPAIAANPSFTIGLPAGVAFEAFDDRTACARSTDQVHATCTPADGVLAAGTDFRLGMTLTITAVPKDPNRRVLSLDAASDTPDPVLPNTTAMTISLDAAAAKARAKTIRLTVAPGKSKRINVLKYVVRPAGAPKTGKFTVTVVKKGKGAARKGKVTVRGTTITYKAKRSSKKKRILGSDTFGWTFDDHAGNKVSGTAKVAIRLPHKKSKKKKH